MCDCQVAGALHVAAALVRGAGSTQRGSLAELVAELPPCGGTFRSSIAVPSRWGDTGVSPPPLGATQAASGFGGAERTAGLGTRTMPLSTLPASSSRTCGCQKRRDVMRPAGTRVAVHRAGRAVERLLSRSLFVGGGSKHVADGGAGGLDLEVELGALWARSSWVSRGRFGGGVATVGGEDLDQGGDQRDVPVLGVLGFDPCAWWSPRSCLDRRRKWCECFGQ